MILNRIWRTVVVVAIATSLLLGNIILPTGPVLAEETKDPFNRDGNPANVGREFDPGVPIENCFWQMTLGSDPYHNAFYPDQQSTYPTALFSLPEGSYLEMKGEFPHVRSMTFSAYFYDPDSDTLVGGDQQIVDYQIEPDEGSINPFRDGADRTAENRSYTLKWVPKNLPELKQKFAKKFPDFTERLKEVAEEFPDVAEKLAEYQFTPNTLYLGEEEFPNIGYIVAMRIFVPDEGTTVFGGTELPEPTLYMPNENEEGYTSYTGDQICKLKDDLKSSRWPKDKKKYDEYFKFKGSMGSVYPSPAFDPVAYKAERDRTEWYNKDRPDSWPAQDPPYIIREWTAKYNFCANFEQGPDNVDQCPQPTDPNVGSGGFINSTTVYLTTWMDRNLGEVLVLQGKKPKTPKTYFSDSDESKIFDTKDAEMRYFSWATDEPLSRSRVIDSVFDEEIPVDENGYYTVVVSRPSYRPKNANYECGYAWLEFPAAGDGFGDLFLGELRNRWQLPMNDFEYAPQNTKIPGDEEPVMGEYFPKGTYYETPEDFDDDFPCKS